MKLFSMEINNIKLPDSWFDVSVDQFIQLNNIQYSEFDSVLSYRIEQLCILSDTSIDDECWSEIDVGDLQEVFSKMSWLTTQPSTRYKKDLDVFKIKELKNITLGEFIDIDSVFSTNYILKLPDICSILYRKFKYDEWEHLLLEPRKYDEQARANIMLDFKITDVYGVITEYLTFKKNFITAFEHLFQDPETSVEEEPVELLTPDERAALNKEKMLLKWNWERIIYNLSDGDMTKFDAITELPLIFVFNQLAMRKELKNQLS